MNQFDYKFCRYRLAKKFAAEDRIGKLAGCFAGLAILISCIGFIRAGLLRGRTADQRNRRSQSSGVHQCCTLWQLMSKDFVLLVIISLLIATPVAYYFMHSWLQNYTYRA